MTRLEQLRANSSRLLVILLFAAIPLYALVAVFRSPDKLIVGTLLLGGLAGLSLAAWRSAPDSLLTRATLAASCAGLPAALTYALGGMQWQLDMHMTFFAALSFAALLVCWRALLFAAGAIALHHLSLNFLLPYAVFPDGPSFLRVVLHAVVVVAQTGALIYITNAIASALTGADEALIEAERAQAKADQLYKDNLQRQEKAEASRQAIEAVSNRFEQTLRGVLVEVGEAARQMDALADQLRSDAAETNSGAETATSRADDTRGHVEAVASAAQELAASIQEVTRTLTSADQVAERAEGEAGKAGGSMAQLREAAREIEDIATLVSQIAEQTNLLALNATIEAARAGEAGKGFAVVASEVKDLADQTARATGDIRARIDAMRQAADEADGGLRQIASTIGDVRGASSSARGAFSEQASATDEIARLAADAAQSTAEVRERSAEVGQAAGRTETVASSFASASEQLKGASGRLNAALDEFRRDLEAAA